jgi:hypothetical protein
VNLDRSRQLLTRLPVLHRDSGLSVPFVLNPNQVRCHKIVKEHYAKHGSIRAIILKARRVGMSSYFDALAVCHCLARAQAHAMIVAHLKEVAQMGLFRVPRDLATALNEKFPGVAEVRAKSIIFPHTLGESNLDIATAGSVGAGRGMTLTFLHLSEAAQYPGQGSFLSILPAVSKAPNTVIALESTAQGKTGIGETFYKYWIGANASGAKWNGFTPIFLSWLDDPACVRPEREAEDAPANDFEKELMAKPFCASLGQIAWMRMVLEGECDGSQLLFDQEYPIDANRAFIATGDPAFTTQEIKYAFSTKAAPIKRGHFERDGKGARFVLNPRGKCLMFEEVKPKCHYFVGVDCARGMEEETGRATGDFAAYTVLNGTTGEIAMRFSDWVNPVEMARHIDAAGRYYNNAMMIIELTGNLGLWCQQVLRDSPYHYPSWYVWKGKDDKKPGKGGNSPALGWETTGRTRDLLLSTFRGKLHDGMKGLPGGLKLKDEECLRQMDIMTMSTGMRWEVQHGHDDVFMSAALAVIACSQYPPPNILNFHANYMDKDKSGNPGILMMKPQPELATALKRDIAMILKGSERKITKAMQLPI